MKFFHASKKLKRKQNIIYSIYNHEGVLLEEEKDISLEAINFFKDLLMANPVEINESLLESIISLVSEEDKKFLTIIFYLQQPKEVVFSMTLEKAPSPNGFTILFF